MDSGVYTYTTIDTIGHFAFWFGGGLFWIIIGLACLEIFWVHLSPYWTGEEKTLYSYALPITLAIYLIGILIRHFTGGLPLL